MRCTSLHLTDASFRSVSLIIAVPHLRLILHLLLPHIRHRSVVEGVKTLFQARKTHHPLAANVVRPVSLHSYAFRQKSLLQDTSNQSTLPTCLEMQI